MSSFFGCLIGSFIGCFVWQSVFNKYVEKQIIKDFEDRWLE